MRTDGIKIQKLNEWATEIHRDNAKWWVNPATG